MNTLDPLFARSAAYFFLGVLAGLVAFLFTGCTQTQIGGDRLSDLGRDAEVVYYRGEGSSRYVVIGQNESRSFQEAAKTVRWRDLLTFGDKASGDWAGVRESRNASDAATDQLEISTAGANEALGIETAAALESERLGLLPDQSP